MDGYAHGGDGAQECGRGQNEDEENHSAEPFQAFAEIHGASLIRERILEGRFCDPVSVCEREAGQFLEGSPRQLSGDLRPCSEMVILKEVKVLYFHILL
jgi:hypothetical protein